MNELFFKRRLINLPKEANFVVVIFFSADISELYQGMWDCPADDPNELPFKRGQIVHIISKVS